MGAGNGTIGSTGTYPDPATWEADIPATLTEPCIGQLLNEEFTGSGIVLDISGHTTSTTNKIVLTCAAGQSFRDHPTAATNPLRYDASKGAAIRSTGGAGSIVIRANNQSNVEIRGVQISGTGGYGPRGIFIRGFGAVVENCLVEMTGSNPVGIRLETSNATKVINTISIIRVSGSGAAGITLSEVTSPGGAYNCTTVKPSDVTANGTGISIGFTNPVVQNCAIFGFAASAATTDPSSGHNATDLSSIAGSSNQTNLAYADQFESTVDATRDFRLKAGSSLIDNGATDSTNAASDIIGTARPSGAAYDIGCWEFVSSGGGTVIGGVVTESFTSGDAFIAGASMAPGVAEMIVTGDSSTGGNIFTTTLADAWTLSDVTTPLAVLFASMSDAFAVGDTAVGPAGTISDSLTETLDLSDDYAGSALWTVAAAAAGAWSPAATSTQNWVPVDPAGIIWIKH